MSLNGGSALNGDVPDLDPMQVERLLQLAAAMSEVQEKVTGNPKLDMAGLMAALAIAEKEEVMITGGILNGGRRNEEVLAGARVANGGAGNRHQTQNSFLHSNFSSSSSSSSSVTNSTSTSDSSSSYNSSNINTSKSIRSYNESTTIRKESYESKQTEVSGQISANSQNNSIENGQTSFASQTGNSKDASFLYPNGNVGERFGNTVTSSGANVRNKKAMFEVSSASNSSTASIKPSPIMVSKFNNKGVNDEKDGEQKFSSVNASSEKVNFDVKKPETAISDNIFKNGSQNSKEHESRVLREYGSGAALLNGSYRKPNNGTSSRPVVPPPPPPPINKAGIKIMPNDITKLEFSKPTLPPPLPTTEPPKQDTINYREQFRMETEAYESKTKCLGPPPFPGTAKYKLAEPVNDNTEEGNMGDAYAARPGPVSLSQDMLSRPAEEPNFQTEKSFLIHELKSKIDGEPEMEKPKPSGLKKDTGITPQQSKALTNLLMQINGGGQSNNCTTKAQNAGVAQFEGIHQSGERNNVINGGRSEEENNALMKKLVYTQYREMLKSYKNEDK